MVQRKSRGQRRVRSKQRLLRHIRRRRRRLARQPQRRKLRRNPPNRRSVLLHRQGRSHHIGGSLRRDKNVSAAAHHGTRSDSEIPNKHIEHGHPAAHVSTRGRGGEFHDTERGGRHRGGQGGRRVGTPGAAHDPPGQQGDDHRIPGGMHQSTLEGIENAQREGEGIPGGIDRGGVGGREEISIGVADEGPHLQANRVRAVGRGKGSVCPVQVSEGAEVRRGEGVRTVGRGEGALREGEGVRFLSRFGAGVGIFSFGFSVSISGRVFWKRKERLSCTVFKVRVNPARRDKVYCNG
mmetsp:Transcript_35675/g.75106  ORF Transcript_35675/g.75106 Transcript_35675/m.75106 type:complete len:294 (-) Transcript_35675:921-1802(-)